MSVEVKESPPHTPLENMDSIIFSQKNIEMEDQDSKEELLNSQESLLNILFEITSTLKNK